MTLLWVNICFLGLAVTVLALAWHMSDAQVHVTISRRENASDEITPDEPVSREIKDDPDEVAPPVRAKKPSRARIRRTHPRDNTPERYNR